MRGGSKPPIQIFRLLQGQRSPGKPNAAIGVKTDESRAALGSSRCNSRNLRKHFYTKDSSKENIMQQLITLLRS
jgi:hypothetical protein